MIKNNEQEKNILENAYQNAQNKDFSSISLGIKNNIDKLISKIDSNKSLVSALVTSLLKKIMMPTQDIRLHRTDFENGYSARVLDTQVTSPFFKDNFPKYANKESSFLTLATRERIKWTKIEGLELKIRDKQLKECFLTIFDDIEICYRTLFFITGQYRRNGGLTSNKKEKVRFKKYYGQTSIALRYRP